MLRTALITGGRFAPLGETNANPFGSVAVRPTDVTTTSAAPGVGRAPTTAVSLVEPWSATFVAGTPPIMTVMSLANSAPVMVTVVPPVVLPTVGEIAVMPKVIGGGAVGLEHAAYKNVVTQTRHKRPSRFLKQRSPMDMDSVDCS
jgi:hypothetical protein